MSLTTSLCSFKNLTAESAKHHSDDASDAKTLGSSVKKDEVKGVAVHSSSLFFLGGSSGGPQN